MTIQLKRFKKITEWDSVLKDDLDKTDFSNYPLLYLILTIPIIGNICGLILFLICLSRKETYFEEITSKKKEKKLS